MENWHIYAHGYSKTLVLGDRIREFHTIVLLLVIIQLTMNFYSYSSVLRANLFPEYRDINSHIILASEEDIAKKSLLEDSTYTQENNIIFDSPDIMPNEKRLWIPSLNINVPIMTANGISLEQGEFKRFEREVQDLLKKGVVELPSSDFNGKIAITGHSSYYPWDDGQYKSVFATLTNLTRDDDIILYYEGKKHIYKIKETKTVWPHQVEILNHEDTKKQISLITCTPIGTNLKRYIVTAELVE